MDSSTTDYNIMESNRNFSYTKAVFIIIFILLFVTAIVLIIIFVLKKKASDNKLNIPSPPACYNMCKCKSNQKTQYTANVCFCGGIVNGEITGEQTTCLDTNGNNKPFVL